MEGGGSHGAARVCCLPEHHQKKQQRGDVSRPERSGGRVTVTAAITPGQGSLSEAKSAGTEEKDSTSRRGKAVAAKRSSATPLRRWEVSPASERPSKARSPGSRSERRKRPESQGRDSPVAKRGAVTALEYNGTRGSPLGADGSRPGKPDEVMRSMTASGEGDRRVGGG